MNHSLSHPVIFMIDDDHMYRHIIDKTLSAELQAEVLTFATADEARASLQMRTRLPDLIILDLELPGTLGQAFLRELKASPDWRDLSVLVMTGHGSTSLQVETLLQGADDFVEKGESSAVVIARVRSQLRHKWSLDHLSKIAAESDRFAADVLLKIEGHLDDLTKIVVQAKTEVNQNSQSKLEKSLTKLRKAGENLSQFTRSILR